MNAITVLIVEDHPLMRAGLTQALVNTHDCQGIGEAEDGRTAVRMATHLKPDVVILDLHLKEPMNDGFVVGSEILKATPNSKILVYSADLSDVYVRKTIEIGFHGYITKGSSPSSAINGIRSAHHGDFVYSPEINVKIAQGVRKPESQVNGNIITAREIAILQLLVKGLDNKGIAGRLAISNSTVQQYLTRIFAKLNVRNRTEAVIAAVKHGLVSLDD